MQDPWQTRASVFHPYKVTTLGDLPERLRGGAKAAFPAGEKFVAALVVPADYRSEGLSDARSVPEQALIFTDCGAMHVRAGEGFEAAPSMVHIRPEAILAMRSSHLVLYGRLELLCSFGGTRTRVDMEFNAVGWPLMQNEWQKLVSDAIGVGSPTIQLGTATGDEQALLSSLPSKFAEGLRKYGLHTGEGLEGVFFQPAIWSEATFFLGFDEQIVPNTALALTDASVLIIEEEKALVHRSEQYGLIITRLPRQAITDVQVATRDDLQELKFMLARAGATAEHPVRLEPRTVEFWKTLWK